jgi:hypothetical protein
MDRWVFCCEERVMVERECTRLPDSCSKLQSFREVARVLRVGIIRYNQEGGGFGDLNRSEYCCFFLQVSASDSGMLSRYLPLYKLAVPSVNQRFNPFLFPPPASPIPFAGQAAATPGCTQRYSSDRCLMSSTISPKVELWSCSLICPLSLCKFWREHNILISFLKLWLEIQRRIFWVRTGTLDWFVLSFTSCMLHLTFPRLLNLQLN